MSDANSQWNDITSEVWDTSMDVLNRWGKPVLFLGTIVWLVLLIYWSLEWRHWDRLFPILIGSITVVLVGIQLVRTISPRANQLMVDLVRPDGVDVEQPNADDARSEVAAQLQAAKSSDRTEDEYRKGALGSSAWIVSFGVMIYFLGYFYAIPLFILLFSLYSYRDWKMPLILTVATSVALYLVFVQFLNVFIWEGVLDLPLPGWL